ncbi:MAG: Helix-turn-helix domain [Bacteroidota bacterium]
MSHPLQPAHGPSFNPYLPFSPLLTVKDVSLLLNMSESTIKRWCRQNKITYILVNRKYLFEPDTIKDFINQHKVG